VVSRGTRLLRERECMSASESVCPGCGLKMPRRDNALYDGGYNTSPECWDVFTEVIGKVTHRLLYRYVKLLLTLTVSEVNPAGVLLVPAVA